MALRFVFNGTTLNGKGYDLLLDGEKIGFATARVTRATTGLHRPRGTTYSACAFDQWFSGSRKTVTRKIERVAKAAQ